MRSSNLYRTAVPTDTVRGTESTARTSHSWPGPAIRALKAVLHLLLLTPILRLVWRYRSGVLNVDPDPINTLTHFTGNWAMWILLGSLAITPVRRLSPRLTSLVRIRRMTGLYAFFYGTLHLATYIFLFSGFDLPGALHAAAAGHPGEFVRQGRQVWPTIRDDLQKRRFIQVGLFSWVILLSLAVTSPMAALRVLGGRRWSRLHRLIYVAAIAAVIHFWWLVKAGNRAPWLDTTLLGLLLAARLAITLERRLKRLRSSRQASPLTSSLGQ